MKKTPSCPVFWIKAALKTHCFAPTRKTILIPAALIWSPFLRLYPSLLLIHAIPKHVVSPDKKEKRGEQTDGQTEREKKREGGKKEKDGADGTV